MEKLQFEITINAPREKVWDVLWNNATYPEWTAPFGGEGSLALTDWKKGSKVLFLGPGGNEGMSSLIADNIPGEYMSIKHLGIVKDGIEDFESEGSKQWSGAMENYTLKTTDGKTQLTVDTDTISQYKDFFTDAWPKALDNVKELSEA